MSQWLKQSTAATLCFGPFVDDADGKTAEVALAIAQADIRLSKAGGAFAQTNNVAGAAHDENGYYAIPLDATDTDTLGRLRVAVSKAGALPVWQDLTVLPANVFDSLCGADRLDVGEAESIATGAVDADALAADAASEIAAACWAVSPRTLTQSAASVTAAVSGSTHTIRRGDTWIAAITGLGNIVGHTKLWYTVKQSLGQADSTARILLERTAGLTVLNGAAYATPASGTIVVNDAALGNITITLDEAATALLAEGVLAYDIQVLDVDGHIHTLTDGTCMVEADVTRAVS